MNDSLSRKIFFDPGYVGAFEAKVFIEGSGTTRKLTNFFVLLLLSTIIATYGVLSDSTATVIGAMIVAPLMGPIMATAAAIVMGSSQRALRALALAVVGIAAVIAFSWVLTLVVPDIAISFTENGEIASRITPNLYALFTALGAGAAGAFILSREEIADSMGGVAIAISLVPPLCVVGIALSQGQWGAAAGAMLLFMTNFLAILLAGGIVFMLGGLGRPAASETNVKMRRRAFTIIVVGTLLIIVPLAFTTRQAINNTAEMNTATEVAQQWLEDTSNQLVGVETMNELVVVTVRGGSSLRPLQELADEMGTALERTVVVDLHVIPMQTERAASASGG